MTHSPAHKPTMLSPLCWGNSDILVDYAAIRTRGSALDRPSHSSTTSVRSNTPRPTHLSTVDACDMGTVPAATGRRDAGQQTTAPARMSRLQRRRLFRSLEGEMERAAGASSHPMKAFDVPLRAALAAHLRFPYVRNPLAAPGLRRRDTLPPKLLSKDRVDHASLTGTHPCGTSLSLQEACDVFRVRAQAESARWLEIVLRRCPQ